MGSTWGLDRRCDNAAKLPPDARKGDMAATPTRTSSLLHHSASWQQGPVPTSFIQPSKAMTIRLVLLGLALFCPGLALADPFSAVGVLASYGSATAVAAGVGGSFWGLSAATWFYVGAAASAVGSRVAKARAKTATRQAAQR